PIVNTLVCAWRLAAMKLAKTKQAISFILFIQRIAFIQPIYFDILMNIEQFSVFKPHRVQCPKCRPYIRAPVKWATSAIDDYLLAFCYIFQVSAQFIDVLLFGCRSDTHRTFNEGIRSDRQNKQVLYFSLPDSGSERFGFQQLFIAPGFW